jgi:hypothetical protein
VRKLAWIAVAVLLAACAKDIQNKEAVRLGVVDYLKTRQAQTGLDMNLMQVDVTTLSFSGTEARAAVFFRPKGGDGGGGMSINYVLDRKGDHWVVRGKQENGSNPHGAGGETALPQLPPDHPSIPGTESPAKALPPGHPTVGTKK